VPDVDEEQLDDELIDDELIDEELIDDKLIDDKLIDDNEEIAAEIGVAEPEDPQPVFDEPVASPAPVRAAPRDVFDFDDDPEAHYFADDDHTSDEPRRSAD
jgi:hypothetical protein